MKRTIFVAAMLAVGAYALAQPEPPQAGPPKFGGPRMGPGMQGGAGILHRPDVQKELKLTEEQLNQLDKVMGRGAPGRGPGLGPPGPPPLGSAPGEGPPPPPPPRPPGGQGMRPDPAQMEKRDAEMDAKIKTILKDAQYKRYHELDLQLQGPSALGRKSVADKVGLSEEKQKQIRDILDKQRNEMRPPPGPPEEGNFEDFRAKMDKMRKESDAKILALLSTSEREKWQAMLGEKFEFDRQGR